MAPRCGLIRRTMHTGCALSLSRGGRELSDARPGARWPGVCGHPPSGVDDGWNVVDSCCSACAGEIVRMSTVGIFWWYQGQLIGKAVPLHMGVDDGAFIDGPDAHMDYWERVRGAFPALRLVEYEAIPRGRV